MCIGRDELNDSLSGQRELCRFWACVGPKENQDTTTAYGSQEELAS